MKRTEKIKGTKNFSSLEKKKIDNGTAVGGLMRLQVGYQIQSNLVDEHECADYDVYDGNGCGCMYRYWQ